MALPVVDTEAPPFGLRKAAIGVIFPRCRLDVRHNYAIDSGNRQYLERAVALFTLIPSVIEELRVLAVEPLVQLSRLFVEAGRTERRIHAIGNGGSAALCQHMEADFARPDVATLPGWPRLTTPMSNLARLSMWANDESWDQSLSSYVAQEVGQDDILLVFSASGARGKSSNLRNASAVAHIRGATTVLLENCSREPSEDQSWVRVPITQGASPEVYESVALAVAHELRTLTLAGLRS